MALDTMLDFTFNNKTTKRQYGRTFFEKIVIRAARELGLEQYRLGLSVNLVSTARMKSLNKKYRGKDTPTDVLSFPIESSFPKKSKSSIIELGDIFIAIEVAAKKAIEYDVSMRRELAFLTVHGFLHLLGYDHERSKKDEHEMFKLQDKILKSF